MAKDFKTLVRIRKWTLDEKQRELGDMLRVLEQLIEQREELGRALIAEQKVAAENPHTAGFAYGNFANAVIAERAALVEQIAAQEAKIDSFRDVVAQAFKDMKTAEISERNRVATVRAEEDRKEQENLDEIGSRAATRKDSLM
ncbi:flagellar FliJ family protein [uncultured Thalassospira sp.]|uniref:flagellar FliJ family protein n=1 Tax=uncultured Thalassospira sp. TaxID=404382 RepID=UPI0030DD0B6A|tara:strand:+ start:138 stop:566 length:429 start_codon:yes stop_codon:yes gene_type:complete